MSIRIRHPWRIEIQASLYARLKDPFDNLIVIMDL